MTTTTPALEGRELTRVFSAGDTAVHAVTEVSLDVRPGELLVVRGPSGSGKTTLLNMLGGLDVPTSGTVLVQGQDVGAMSEAQALALRREHLSYVFQSFGLVPVLSAAENVEVPLRLARVAPEERDRRVAEALELVGLGDHTAQRPFELSGGQQQRVGIARALVSAPSVLIADEPTGQLDSQTAASVMDLLHELVHERGLAAVVSTHDPLLVARADRVLELHDGRATWHANAGRHAAEPSPA